MSAPIRPEPVDDPVAHYLSTYGGGTAPEHADPVAHYMNTYKPAPAGPPAGSRSTANNVLNTVDDALTLGYGQKFNAALTAGWDAIRGKDSFSHSYDKNFEADKQGREELARQHPIAAGVAGGVGGALPVLAAAPFAAAGEVANGLSLGTRTLAAARTGAGFGAINQMGHTNAQNTGDVVGAAGKGAAIGGVLSAGMVPAAQVIGSAASTLARRAGPLASKVSSALMPWNDVSSPGLLRMGAVGAEQAGGSASASEQPIDRATQMLLQRMQRTGLTPGDAIARAETIPLDKPVSVMEIAGDQSHPLRQLGKWVARTPSTGQTELRAAVATRSDPLPNAQRVLNDVGEAIGAKRRNVIVQAEKMGELQREEAKPFYDRAKDLEQTPPVPLDSRVDDGPSLQELLKRPSIRNAVKFHNDIAAERSEEPLTLPHAGTDAAPAKPPTAEDFSLYERLSKMNGANEDATTKAMQQLGYSAEGIAAIQNGGATSSAAEGIPIKTLQKLKFKLDDALGFAKRNGQLPDGTPATNAKLGAINDTRVALLKIMNQHSPDFAHANEIWGGHAALQDALEEGQNFLGRPIDELQTAYSGMTSGERQQHNAGAVSGPIRDRLFAGNAVDRAKMLNSPDMQERLGVVVPREKLAELQRKAAIEHEIALTNQQIPNGSDTFENFANDADANGKMARSIVGGLAGRPRSAIRAVVNGIVQPAVDQWVHGINEQTANTLAPKLSAGMMSRDDLIAMLTDLSQKHAALMRIRGTPPLMGANVGVTMGNLSNRPER